MPAFFLIFETLPKQTFWYRQQLLLRIFFYLFNRSKTLSFHRCLQFWEEDKVSGGQVRRIRWLRHNYGFVFGQKLTYKHRCVSWCVSLTNCFAQSAHNFKVVFLIVRTTLWQSWCTTPLQSKTLSQTFTFDRTWCAYFNLGSSWRFHWDNWALVSMS